MADEVSYANQGDLVIAAILNQAIYELIADRVDLRHTVFFADDPAGSGSAVVKVPQVLFDEVMASVAEAVSVSNSILGDAAITLTAGRYALRYDTTDLFQMVSTGKVDIARLAAGIAMGAVRAASGLIATAGATFSASAGTTGTDWSVDSFYDSQFALEEADVPGGEIFAVWKQHQFTEFQSSLRGEGGAIQFQGNTAALLAMKAQGFKGEFNGVQIWTSNQVTDDAVDYSGFMFARGAIAGVEVSPNLDKSKVPVSPFLQVAVPESAVFVEMERSAAGGLTQVVGNYYAGFGINEDTRGVGNISGV